MKNLIKGILVPDVLQTAIVAVGVGLDVKIGVGDGTTVLKGVGVKEGDTVGV